LEHRITGKIIYLAFPLETTANDSAFNSVISNSIEYFLSEPTAIANEPSIINDFKLYQNYPNPFNPATKIKYRIPLSPPLLKGELVTLKVYDILGNEIATLVNEVQSHGEYEIDFSAESGSASGRNGSSLSSGIYFYQLKAGDFTDTKRMILLK